MESHRIMYTAFKRRPKPEKKPHDVTISPSNLKKTDFQPEKGE